MHTNYQVANNIMGPKIELKGKQTNKQTHKT